jgi:2-dehydropantoate 2-reductase
MRFVVCGAGAIGGVVGARLHQAGHDVTLIARGPHYDAISRDGLTLQTPDERDVLRIAAVDHPGAIDWRPDHVILLATKSQDTAAALGALTAAASVDTPIVCIQNGVENERLALRRFANVYAAVVMAPTAHLEPGVVQAYGTEMTGVIDLGRYPSGVDGRTHAISEVLGGARFSSLAHPDIMRFKYAKLLANLANAVDATCGPDRAADGADCGAGQLVARAREEGAEVLRAAGIEFVAADDNDVWARWLRLGVRPIGERKRAGSSTWQSLERGSGVEIDYLNGEIVLLGRLHGVRTPVNELLQALVLEMARDGRAPGSLSAQNVLARLR